MRIFVTGATGYIGRVVTEQALAEGHAVYGLSRNEAGDAQLRAQGATPVRGDLTSLDALGQASAQAEAVLHLAYIHDFGMDYEEVLRIDAAAVDALGGPLRGTEKAFVITSGTALVDPDPDGGETTEDSPLTQTFALKDRIRSERHALRLSEDGVRVSAIRLPPYVYGRGGSTFMPMLMQMAAKAGESVYVDDGRIRTSDVHVDDAAALYLLAARKAKAGDVFNGTGSTTVTLRQMAEAIGAALKLPVRSVSREEAEARWGQFLTVFVQFENRSSNRKAVQQLGWQPKEIDMLTDIQSGSYRELAAKLRQG
ncbi:MAG: SDR family oxidoreductase [Bryobacteraceae bacterium]|nr:SDR family oxidoreductase [Bryobacteraceae bacterium]